LDKYALLRKHHLEDVEKDRQCAEVFDALGHPTRIAILKALGEGTIGFGNLKKKTGIESSGHLQHHLNKLNDLIKTDEYGKYRLSDQGKDALLTIQAIENATQTGLKEPERKRHGISSKNVWKLITMFLAFSLVASSAVAVLEYTQTTQLQTELNRLKEKIATGTSKVWERDLGTNIGDFVVADGKVFTITFGGDLYTFGSQDGRILWSYSLGGYASWGHLLTVAGGGVYAGSRGSVLTCFSEDTGTFLWQFKPNVSSSHASKSPPDFEVSNDRVLVNAEGFYVLDAVNGTVLWDSHGHPDVYQALALADNRVFSVSISGAPDYARSLVSLNADTGQQQWSTKIGHDVGSLVVANGRIVLWGLYENQTTFGLDEASGTVLWRFDANGTAFQPMLADGLVLFGASNGNFYAINQNDGTLKWAYPSANQLDYVAFSTAIPDSEQVLIGYVTYSQPQFEVNYQGYVRSLNLVDGKLNWETRVSNISASRSVLMIDLTPITNRLLYVTVFSDLYCINVDSGKLQWKKSFAYWVLPPAYASGTLFVAADLKITAYQ
jgi:outer membrane protein assembly factor BamB/DNA-binding HxlR family transcriptional regulator